MNLLQRFTRQCFVGVLLVLIVAGCGSNGSASEETAAPTATVTVTETVEITPSEGREESIDAADVPTSLDLYSGSYFTISYPRGWYIDTDEVAKGSYLDTTIRSSDGRPFMLRVDVSPGIGYADPVSLARPVVDALEAQRTYRLLDFRRSTFRGYDAVRWEFTVSEDGVPLRKVDIFFTDDAGNHFAVLTQAPLADYSARWSSLLSQTRKSIVLSAAPASAEQPDVNPAPPNDDPVEEGAFCDTHECIPNFDEGTGYAVQCEDGEWSQSGGRPGACSYHGGVLGGGSSSDSGYGVYDDPNNDGSYSNWCGASRDGDGDGLWCEGR